MVRSTGVQLHGTGKPTSISHLNLSGPRLATEIATEVAIISQVSSLDNNIFLFLCN